MFVRRQWLTTRKQLYRQAVTQDSQEYFKKQIKRHNLFFISMSIFFIVFLALCSIAYYLSNKKSYEEASCFIVDDECRLIHIINKILTTYMILTIIKNMIISLILFVSLYKFYAQLKTIGLQFKVGKCNLFLHIFAFGMPVVSGIIYLTCIFYFN